MPGQSYADGKKFRAADRQDLHDWLVMIQPMTNAQWKESLLGASESVSARYEQTLSWRVTKPLRVFGSLRSSLVERGFSATLSAVWKRIRR